MNLFRFLVSLAVLITYVGSSSTGRAQAPDNRRTAPAATNLFTLPGFHTELVLGGGPEDGSWVSLCTDDRGRLILSPQHARANPSGGLMRVTLGPDGAVAAQHWIARPLYDAQGMVFAYGALWVVVNKYNSSYESGLYRVTDSGNDRYEKIELVKRLPGGGEHGPHAVELGPDGMIYVMAGNHTRLPEGLDVTSPHRNYHEDHLLPRQWDGNGHAAGILAPGGYILRTDREAQRWELFCAGFRNQYDFAFNADGELFTYDSDMEWDWGMPWYRPTRVNHCVSAAEFGWRSGTGKWPDYYADSLPGIDIGIGSPTGVVSGKGTRFPARYQRALYIMDWTYGRLMAVHLEPDGAGYAGDYENFVCPKGLAEPGAPKPPLNLTDMTVGRDGALYFTIGGRNTAAGLYRVTYTGQESTAPAFTPHTKGAAARKLRQQLERYHGREHPKAVEEAWPHLDSEDRWIRYAARIAIESQPVATWRGRALGESRPRAGLTALLALARVDDKTSQAELFQAVGRWPMQSLDPEWQLNKLRLVQLSCIRQGRPAPDLARLAIQKLSPRFPGTDERVNRELAQILIYLDAPDVIEKTLRHMGRLRFQEDILHYVFHLRTARNWTLDQRREYFSWFGKDRSNWGHPSEISRWFEEAGRPYGDGASFANFMRNFRKEAEDNLSAAERSALEPVLAALPAPGGNNRRAQSGFPAPQQRGLIREWKTEDLAPALDEVGRGRNFNKGRQAFVDAQCLACHRFGNEGGGVGPDLTAVSARFSRRDILEAITEPSKVVSEQYQNLTLHLKDGEAVTGRILDESTTHVVVQPNPLEPGTVKIPAADILRRQPSRVSPMPEGLIHVLTKDEVLDLLAFIEAVGQNSGPAFRR